MIEDGPASESRGMLQLLQRVTNTALVAIGGVSSAIAVVMSAGSTRLDLPLKILTIGFQAAALVAAGLSLVLTWRTRRRDSLALATFLAFFAVSIGVMLTSPVMPAGWYSIIRDSTWYRAVTGLIILSAPGFMAASFGRFSAIFPRELVIDDFDGSDQRLSEIPGSIGALGRLASSTFGKAGRTSQKSKLFGSLESRLLSDSRTKMENALAFFRSRKVWLLGILPCAVGSILSILPVRWWSQDSAFLLLAFYACGILIIGGTYPIAFLLTSYSVADAAGRRRMLWIMQGAVSAFWICAAGGVMNLIGDVAQHPWPVISDVAITAFPLALLAFLTCVAIAIFHDGALDPRLAIRRTALYGGLGIIALFLFAGLENVITNVLAAKLGFSASVGTWIAGGSVAVGMAPLRSYVVKRFMPKDRAGDVLIAGEPDATGGSIH